MESTAVWSWPTLLLLLLLLLRRRRRKRKRANASSSSTGTASSGTLATMAVKSLGSIVASVGVFEDELQRPSSTTTTMIPAPTSAAKMGFHQRRLLAAIRS